VERQRIVTLLPDRETATVRNWLSDHPEIRVVSRDRGGGYPRMRLQLCWLSRAITARLRRSVATIWD
jgi:hypothetical protein